MNDLRSSLTLILCLSLIVIAGLACNSFNRSDEPSEQPSSPLVPSRSSAPEIGGDYTIAGSNPNGSSYGGSLAVMKRDQVYQFSWTSGNRQYDGVGVRVENTVAVAFSEGSDGKGCGVVLYKIATDGSLDGKSGYWGVNSSESEKAVRTSGTDLAGLYNVTGKNTGGGEYKGTLAVNRQGAGYNFQWDAGSSFNGFGIRSGDKAAVGIGGAKCGFVSYEIKPDGTLDGQWGGQGSTVVGTEVARKR